MLEVESPISTWSVREHSAWLEISMFHIMGDLESQIAHESGQI